MRILPLAAELKAIGEWQQHALDALIVRQFSIQLIDGPTGRMLDPAGAVRDASARSLTMRRDERICTAMRQALSSEKERTIRAAASALGKLKDQSNWLAGQLGGLSGSSGK